MHKKIWTRSWDKSHKRPLFSPGRTSKFTHRASSGAGRQEPPQSPDSLTRQLRSNLNTYSNCMTSSTLKLRSPTFTDDETVRPARAMVGLQPRRGRTTEEEGLDDAEERLGKGNSPQQLALVTGHRGVISPILHSYLHSYGCAGGEAEARASACKASWARK